MTLFPIGCNSPEFLANSAAGRKYTTLQIKEDGVAREENAEERAIKSSHGVDQ